MPAARDVHVWRVAFYGDPVGWERLLIRPGFRHCSAIGWVDTGRWLEIDANLARIETRVLDHAAYVARLVELETRGARILSVDAGDGHGLRWSPTCAGIIAGVVGVKGALRPYGLYRVLLRHAAKSRSRSLEAVSS